jgi:prefoldin subunit 5
MSDSQDKSVKEVEKELEDIRRRADALEQEIQQAEDKHPRPIDHAEDGGVF